MILTEQEVESKWPGAYPNDGLIFETGDEKIFWEEDGELYLDVQNGLFGETLHWDSTYNEWEVSDY